MSHSAAHRLIRLRRQAQTAYRLLYGGTPHQRLRAARAIAALDMRGTALIAGPAPVPVPGLPKPYQA